MPQAKKLAIIGDPISHSLSPLMHQAALNALGLPHTYQAIRVAPAGLKKFMRQRASKFLGFNVTLPHKEKILPYLDRIDAQAKLIGAVNTVVNREGRWLGFNTDGIGYLTSLREAGFNPRRRRIVMLGAGGAARALAAALALAGAKSLALVNRDAQRAFNLAATLAPHFVHTPISGFELQYDRLKSLLKSCDLLINTTSVGLHQTRFDNFPWSSLKKNAWVSDIVYRPRLTPFLKSARRLGHPILTGEGMLLYQGALAFEIWTGQKPNIPLMRRTLLQTLKNQKPAEKDLNASPPPPQKRG